MQDRRKEKVDLAKPFHNILLLSIETVFPKYAPASSPFGSTRRDWIPTTILRDPLPPLAKRGNADAIDQRDATGDPEGRNLLGWSRKSNEYNSDDSSSEAKRSILLLGDSVTQ